MQYTDFISNQLAIPDALVKELKAQGLAHRFVNATTFRDEYSVHRSGWKPYNVKSRTTISKLTGMDPEGIIRRGDLVLAVRPLAVSQQHRKVLDQRNNRLKNFNKEAAQSMRSDAARAGVDMKIIEGYEGQKMGAETE